jgi:hypothetical protein
MLGRNGGENDNSIGHNERHHPSSLYTISAANDDTASLSDTGSAPLVYHRTWKEELQRIGALRPK